VGQNQAGQNNLQQSNNYYSDDVVNNAGIEKEFRYIRDIKEIPLADFSNTVTQEAFKTIMSISGVIQVEDYDVGGQSVSFYDKDFVNEGNVYREDGVDVVGFGCADSAMTEDCKGFAIGYTQAGEWLEYSVNVATASKYVFRANVATGLEGGSFRLFLDGKAVTDTIAVPQGEDWNTYATVDGETAELAKGDHVLRIQFTGNYVNMDWIKFALTSEELETTGLKVAEPRLKLGESGYDVFGMNGKYICRIEGMAAMGGIKAALAAKGVKPGMYVVRGLDSHRSVKVNMVK
jgi:hypothetical protein